MRTGLAVINDRNAASLASFRHVGIRPVRRLVLVRVDDREQLLLLGEGSLLTPSTAPARAPTPAPEPAA